ncbi:hypothetical protein ACH5RR_002588 [Cinchona calisaya]|uniref:Uncharacterized protein n=1 Tax=Cinchona calisaya TaxID=153742 RepID=A0ABD3ASC5_9GENT
MLCCTTYSLNNCYQEKKSSKAASTCALQKIHINKKSSKRSNGNVAGEEFKLEKEFLSICWTASLTVVHTLESQQELYWSLLVFLDLVELSALPVTFLIFLTLVEEEDR